jgi:hypothetical protein
MRSVSVLGGRVLEREWLVRVLALEDVQHPLQLVVYELLAHDVVQHRQVVHLLVNLLELSLLPSPSSLARMLRRVGSLTALLS